MRVGWLLLLLLLAQLTAIAYRPLLGGGVDTVDPVLLLLVWFSLVDHPRRLALLLLLVVTTRVVGGVAGAAEALIPLLAALATTRVLRGWIDPYDPYKRFGVVVPAIAVAHLGHRWLLMSPAEGGPLLFFGGLLVASLSALMLFPILDLATPILRSARYPM